MLKSNSLFSTLGYQMGREEWDIIEKGERFFLLYSTKSDLRHFQAGGLIDGFDSEDVKSKPRHRKRRSQKIQRIRKEVRFS